MCGRFANAQDWQTYVESIRRSLPTHLDVDKGSQTVYNPRYTLGPGTSHAIVRTAGQTVKDEENEENEEEAKSDGTTAGDNKESTLRMVPMYWGVEAQVQSRKQFLINARSETISSGSELWASMVRSQQMGIL